MYMRLQSDENCCLFSKQNGFDGDQKFYLVLICPENGLPEGLWFVQVLSGKVETGSFVLS